MRVCAQRWRIEVYSYAVNVDLYTPAVSGCLFNFLDKYIEVD